MEIAKYMHIPKRYVDQSLKDILIQSLKGALLHDSSFPNTFS